MKFIKALLLSILTLGATSCADFFMPYDKNEEYKKGVATGKAQIVRQQYWEAQSKPVEPPALEKRYTAITVPEHTTPDGVIVEAHTEYVETVR